MRYPTIRAAAAAVSVAGLAAGLLAATAAGASASVSPAAIRAAQAAVARDAGLSPAAGSTSEFLATGTLAVKAGGRTWTVTGDISANDFGEPASVTLQISTPDKGGQEAHDWTFGKVPAGDVSVNASTGAASVNTGSKGLASYGSLKLSFKPTSHTTMTCKAGGKDTTYSGKVTGSVRLVTGLHKLTVSKSGATFSGLSQLSVETDFCSPSPCDFAAWEAASSSSIKLPFTLAAGVQVGKPGHLIYDAEVDHLVELSKAQEITRGDGAIIAVKAPSFSKSSKKLTITTTKSGAVTGSLVIGPAKASAPEVETCTVGSTTYKETDVSYEGKYTSPKGGALTAHTFLTPSAQIGRTGTGGFDIITKLVKQ
jgi:hypothetical protein